MIRKSGSRFSEKIMLKQKHDPEKACPGLDPGWKPVFRKNHAQPTRRKANSLSSYRRRSTSVNPSGATNCAFTASSTTISAPGANQPPARA